MSISDGKELLVTDMMGVISSNCRMRDVADIPSRFGMTISYEAVMRKDERRATTEMISHLNKQEKKRKVGGKGEGNSP